jgi:phosphate transport system protein
MVLQARQATVARDLRLLYTVQGVTDHLICSGTLCEHICRAIAETADSERNENLEAALLEMDHAARNVSGEGSTSSGIAI